MNRPIIHPELCIVATLDHDMILTWLRQLRLKAYAAGSNYKVAAVLAMRRENDYVLIGAVNVECIDHRHGTHGESSAVSTLATAFGKKGRIDAVWTLGAPAFITGPCNDPLADMPGFCCGDCRQHINELARSPDIPMHSFSVNGTMVKKSLNELLPDSFTFANINPLILQAKNADNNFIDHRDIEEICSCVLKQDELEPIEVFEWMNSLSSIDYASGVHQAIVLRLSNGTYVAGVKVENAAYVGLSAMQGALANAVTTFGTIEVKEIFALSKGRIADNEIYPVALSSIQTLNEFVRDDPRKIPVTMFTPSGGSITIGLGQAASLNSSFSAPGYLLNDGKLAVAS